MDELLRALYKWFKNSGLMDNTTIMVMNDNEHPTRPAPAKEREVECYYCCDLICDLLIAGLTAPVPATINDERRERERQCKRAETASAKMNNYCGREE